MVNVIFVLVGLFSFTSHARGSDWQVRTAVYRVPVPEGLSNFAHFPMSEVKTRFRDNLMQIEYTLPEELTGKPIQIEAASSTPDNTRLTGSNCEMICSGNICEINYKNLNVNEQTIREYWLQKGVSSTELESRVQVFRFFDSGNPAGTITFE